MAARREEGHLVGRALEPLMDAELIGIVQEGSRTRLLCKRTGWTESLRIVGETKTTHNLPPQMNAQSVAEIYDDIRRDVDVVSDHAEPGTHPLGWSRVGHPISKAPGYVILNK